MRPALEPGDWAIAIVPARVRRGDIVVVEHPERPGLEIVKRVVNVSGDVAPDGFSLVDQVWIEGDEPESSTDSRQFGPVATDRVRGRVRLVWWPPNGFGWCDPSQVTPGCGISYPPGSICSCNDPDTLPWSRRGDDPDRCCCPGVPGDGP